MTVSTTVVVGWAAAYLFVTNSPDFALRATFVVVIESFLAMRP